MKATNLWELFSPTGGGSAPGGATASADPESKKRGFLLLVAIGLVFYAYVINRTCMVGVQPTSLAGWLLSYWSRGGEYAHGYVVPVAALGLFLWRWKTKLHAVPMNTSGIGLGVVVLAMMMYWGGVRAENPRLVAGSLVVLIFGLVLYLAGWDWAKELWFPCVFLLFMIPLNFLEPYVSFPLRMFVARFSSTLLNILGMDVYQDGTGIYSRAQRFQPLDVADPCSGIRSLVALMALTSLYGYVTMDKAWKKWLLFFASIPLAVIGNLARITTVALVAQGFGQEFAMKIYHDYSSYIVFSLAILCMIALGAALSLHYREMIDRWTKEDVGPRRPKR